ncbi:glycosyltransferase family 39 protein [Pseudarthrobacter sp. B4EP4b]|uniref:glycosyltransferase family 39 protein n=1 Tax=Pseudarthrobacter sp. B4EP4b TaxID=2590664 RepID=UPI00114E8883|nr:glycosyltransferase family 39 protein [Pseudarthrobacter sp. B4EP4b]
MTLTTLQASTEPGSAAPLTRFKVFTAGRLRQLWRGRREDPAWERPVLLSILAANALLYSWNLGINGWANYFYSAAVQAGTMDAKAFFFGSSDWGNSITVDKPPLSLWVMGLSVRLFGFNPPAMLLPQVLMGIGTTLLIYMILRRCASSVAALLGATVFFTTPIVTLMSRYNNPDPLMLLLMVAAVWFVLRSIETGRGRFFVMAGALLGLAFMTKQLQGMLSVPALGLAFVLFSPQPWARRLATAAVAISALIVTGGLWMTVVDLLPAGDRPYVGGSPSNSVIELTFAYNGVDRIVTNDVMPEAVQVPIQFRPVESDAGLFRLLNANYNQEASWLLVGALLAVCLLAVRWNKLSRHLPIRPLVLLSGIWLMTAFLLLSFMGDQIHTYYTATLAPPLALVLGLTLDTLVSNRDSPLTRLGGATVALIALLSSWLILTGTAEWPNWLPTAVLGIGIAAIAALVIKPPTLKMERVAAWFLAASLLCGPLATSVHNVTVGFNGSNPLSGVLTKNPATISHFMESLRNNELVWAHDIAFGRVPDTAVVDALADARDCTWAAASYASQTAARLQLESGRAVMPLGGFAGSDPSPTLEDFKEKVAAGEICYLVQQEAFLEVQASEGASTAISHWVQQNFASEKLGNTTVYRLTKS